jgi:hypothetical protein
VCPDEAAKHKTHLNRFLAGDPRDNLLVRRSASSAFICGKALFAFVTSSASFVSSAVNISLEHSRGRLRSTSFQKNQRPDRFLVGDPRAPVRAQIGVISVHLRQNLSCFCYFLCVICALCGKYFSCQHSRGQLCYMSFQKNHDQVLRIEF